MTPSLHKVGKPEPCQVLTLRPPRSKVDVGSRKRPIGRECYASLVEAGRSMRYAVHRMSQGLWPHWGGSVKLNPAYRPTLRPFAA